MVMLLEKENPLWEVRALLHQLVFAMAEVQAVDLSCWRRRRMQYSVDLVEALVHWPEVEVVVPSIGLCFPLHSQCLEQSPLLVSAECNCG